ncbi:MAG: PKD domain-containing protein [Saprospiraceae bacterium]
MLKRFRKYYFLLSSFLFIIGCTDDTPLPSNTDGNVVFELSAIIDGQENIWAAGVDNQYMYTYTTQDSNGLTQFQGTLGEVGCQFCSNSINFDFVQSPNSNSINDLFVNGQTINYRDATIPVQIIGYNTSFEVNLNGTAPYTFDCDFGDGSTPINTSTSNFQHQYTQAGTYNVCVNITDATGCQSTICRDISTDNTMSCAVNFSVFNLGNGFTNSFFFHTYSAGVPPFNYQWNVPLDQTTIQNFVVQSPTVTINQLGTLNVDVAMTDDNGCDCSLAQTVNFNNLDTASCAHRFDYLSQPITAPGLIQDYFSTLNIQYVDNNGIIYSSALGEQPNSSFINITNIEDFSANENDLPTKKITLEFACRLYDVDGNHKDLNNGSGTIGIAYE